MQNSILFVKSIQDFMNTHETGIRPPRLMNDTLGIAQRSALIFTKKLPHIHLVLRCWNGLHSLLMQLKMLMKLKLREKSCSDSR